MKKVILFFIALIIFCCKNTDSKNDMETKQKIGFYDVFPEKVEINFTPNDLVNTINPTLIDFKKKLKSYEDSDPTIDGIGSEELSSFISNNTNSTSEGYVDSSWLEYFINKYDLHYTFNDLMNDAINQEDLNAVRILIKKGYVFRSEEIETANEVKNYSLKQIKFIKENKGLDEKGDVVLYDSKYSKFNEILNLITSKYNSNKIYDKDGYTNLREGAGTNFAIIAKIKSGEHIDVIDNPQRKWESVTDEEGYNWFEVQTKEGIKGYVHKSRIVSE